MTRNSFPFPFKLLNCFPFTSVEISLFIEWDTVVCFKSLLQFGFQQLRMLNTLTYSLFTDFTQLNLIALHSRTDTHTHICILTHMHQSCDSSSHASLRSFDAQNKHDDRVAKLLPVRLAATVGIVVVSVIAGASVATLLYRAGKKSLSKRQTTTWPHKQLQMLHLHAWPDAASGLVSPSPPSLTLSKLHRWTPLLFRQVTYATHTQRDTASSHATCKMVCQKGRQAAHWVRRRYQPTSTSTLTAALRQHLRAETLRLRGSVGCAQIAGSRGSVQRRAADGWRGATNKRANKQSASKLNNKLCALFWHTL